VVAQEQVVRYFKDHADREVARKLALAKALHHLDMAVPTCGEPEDLEGYSPRELTEVFRSMIVDRKVRRRLFWEAYLGRKRRVSSTADGIAVED
jgi:hypothetical protein